MNMYNMGDVFDRETKTAFLTPPKTCITEDLTTESRSAGKSFISIISGMHH